MRELDLGHLKIQGDNLQKEVERLQINLGAIPEEEKRNEDDFNMKYPPDDEKVSRLPYAIRGAKRFLTNLVSLETEQVLEVGLFYSWNGLANQWEPALSVKAGIEAIGYAVATNRLQFWGLAPVKRVVAGQKVYLSASLAGRPTSTRSRHVLGVGVAKGTAFLDTLRGLLK